jgi:hypothetical protein
VAGDCGKPVEDRTALVRRLDDVVEQVEQALMKERQRLHLTVRYAALGCGEDYELFSQASRTVLGCPGKGEVMRFT